MRNPQWNTTRRETGLIEHQCEHGVGHPNHYSAIRLNEYDVWDTNPWKMHACDGCCNGPDFPGRVMPSHERFGIMLDQIASGELDEEIAKEYCFHDLYINDLFASKNPKTGRRAYAAAWLEYFDPSLRLIECGHNNEELTEHRETRCIDCGKTFDSLVGIWK